MWVARARTFSSGSTKVHLGVMPARTGSGLAPGSGACAARVHPARSRAARAWPGEKALAELIGVRLLAGDPGRLEEEEVVEPGERHLAAPAVAEADELAGRQRGPGDPADGA